MYREYFRFTADPFGITPDPRFFYENPIYREAFAKLSWGIAERRGLMTLIGAVGTGKTTVLRHLVAKSTPAVRCIFAEYPASSFDELLDFACGQMGLPSAATVGRLERVTALKQALLENQAENVPTALLLDEAQQLTEETLEGVRLLSNLENAGTKALQIVLAGQPELRAKLDQPALAPLKQRITYQCRLDGLSPGEIAAYIEYRLLVAGYRGPDLFGPNTVEAIGFYSGGVPRLINVLCGEALIRVHRTSQRVVSSDIIVETARGLHIGPAFEFTPSRPDVPDASSPRAAISGPGSIRRPPALTRPGGRLPKGTAARSWQGGGRPLRRTGNRRWMRAAVGGLACVVAGAGALALFQSDDSSMASHRDRSAARSLTTRPAGSQAAVGSAADPSAGLSPGNPTPPVTADTASPPPVVEYQPSRAPGVAAPSPSSPQTSSGLDTNGVPAPRTPDHARPPVAAAAPTPSARPGPSAARARGTTPIVQGVAPVGIPPTPSARVAVQGALPAGEPRRPAQSAEAPVLRRPAAAPVEPELAPASAISPPPSQGGPAVAAPPVRLTPPAPEDHRATDPSAIIDWLVREGPKLGE